MNEKKKRINKEQVCGLMWPYIFFDSPMSFWSLIKTQYSQQAKETSYIFTNYIAQITAEKIWLFSYKTPITVDRKSCFSWSNI